MKFSDYYEEHYREYFCYYESTNKLNIHEVERFIKTYLQDENLFYFDDSKFNLVLNGSRKYTYKLLYIYYDCDLPNYKVQQILDSLFDLLFFALGEDYNNYKVIVEAT